MNHQLRSDADRIIEAAIRAVQPDEAVRKALSGKEFPGRIFLVAAGKAAWQMAKTASDYLGDRIEKGIVVTKYNHVQGEICKIQCIEAGHPIPDHNSFYGTEKAMDLVKNLKKEDTVLFLLSGGGSALFEFPLIEAEELQNITKQLLACGADIVEINTIRKRLSAVKGGKFAQMCEPAKVFSIVLSDILGNPLEMIASGPSCADSTTCEEAEKILEKYHIVLSEHAKKMIQTETPKKLTNVSVEITGSVKELCHASKDACEQLGFETMILTDHLCCQAKEAGSFLSSIAKSYQESQKDVAFIAGGETVVKLKGTGMGGRNQELALAAAPGISGLKHTAVFSIGSDGTDGPTNAAGGYVDGDTEGELKELGIDIYQVLDNNDAYHALEKTRGLIITGPTGTNVNDVSIVLIRNRK